MGFETGLQCGGKLRVHRHHIHALGLALADRERAFAEIHVGPRQRPQVTLAQPGKRGGQIPSLAPMLARDRKQPRQFLICQRATNAPPVACLVHLGDDFEVIGCHAASLHRPRHESYHDLPGEVDRPRRPLRVLDRCQVSLQGVNREFAKASDTRHFGHALQMPGLGRTVFRVHASPLAVREIRLDMLREWQAGLVCMAVESRIDDAFTAKCVLGEIALQDALGGAPVGRLRRTLGTLPVVRVPAGNPRPVLGVLEKLARALGASCTASAICHGLLPLL
ncbi:MAG TPA: hypothetical protein VK157_14040 [Phycisphaerales bacterium]|nr:hypothetical protein [Phycisphaerales bacterium]